jgi:hypothetical protein
MSVELVTDKQEIKDIRNGLEAVYKLCIAKGKEAADKGRQLEVNAYFEDANNIQRIIRTLRSV